MSLEQADAADSGGFTPLMYAVSSGDLTLVNYVLGKLIPLLGSGMSEQSIHNTGSII